MRDNRDKGPERLFASQGGGTGTQGFAEAVKAGLSTGTLSTHVAAGTAVPGQPGWVGAGLSPLSLSLDQQRATVTFATALSPKNHPPCTWEARLVHPGCGGHGGPGWSPWSFPGNAQHLLRQVVAPGVVTPAME